MSRRKQPQRHNPKKKKQQRGAAKRRAAAYRNGGRELPRSDQGHSPSPSRQNGRTAGGSARGKPPKIRAGKRRTQRAGRKVLTAAAAALVLCAVAAPVLAVLWAGAPQMAAATDQPPSALVETPLPTVPAEPTPPPEPAPEPSPEPSRPPITGAPAAVAALTELEARVGVLPDAARHGDGAAGTADFARLCATLTGGDPVELAALAECGPVLDRQAAAVLVATGLSGPRLRLLDYTDRGEIPEHARESVEKVSFYGVMEGVDGLFRPADGLTWGEAAALLNRLADSPGRAAPEPASITFQGFSGQTDRLDEGQRAALTDYFYLQHTAMANLAYADPAPAFAPDATHAVELERTALFCLLNERRYAPIDLTMTEYAYALNLISVTPQKDGTVKVYLGEYGAMSFRGLNGAVGEEPLVHHTFVLRQVDGTWRLQRHFRDDTAFTRFNNSTDLEAEGAAYLSEVRDNLLDRRAGAQDPDTPLSCAHPLDRAAAVAYAEQWAAGRNPDFPDYTGSGGNCQNFVSQCLLSGGIPKDSSGNAVWSVGAAPWASVSNFKRYVANNSGFGLVARLDAPYESGEPGDVLHMGYTKGNKHAMLIVGVLRDENGKFLDYLIDSNTCNWKNMPMSAHWYTNQSLIRVYGWND